MAGEPTSPFVQMAGELIKSVAHLQLGVENCNKENRNEECQQCLNKDFERGLKDLRILSYQPNLQ